MCENWTARGNYGCLTAYLYTNIGLLFSHSTLFSYRSMQFFNHLIKGIPRWMFLIKENHLKYNIIKFIAFSKALVISIIYLFISRVTHEKQTIFENCKLRSKGSHKSLQNHCKFDIWKKFSCGINLNLLLKTKNIHLIFTKSRPGAGLVWKIQAVHDQMSVLYL